MTVWNWGETDLTAAEHRARKDHLTGSTYAAYLGYSPYASPFVQWEINAGIRDVEPTDDMDAGNDIEPGIANMVARRHKMRLHKPTSVFHVEHPEAIVVHFDALCDEQKLGVQIKNHNPWVARLADKDNPAREYLYTGLAHAGQNGDNRLVPLHYNMQCQIEMEVARSVYGPEWGDWWMLASFFGGSNLRDYMIRRDQPLIDAMLRVGLQFWREHLDPNGPHAMPIGAPHLAVKPVKPGRRPKQLSAADKATAPIPTYT